MELSKTTQMSESCVKTEVSSNGQSTKPEEEQIFEIEFKGDFYLP